MRIYGCRVCGSAWAASPCLEVEGSHYPGFAPDSARVCRGTVETFLPESMVGTTAADVLRAEAIAGAAIERCEAVASQAQKAIAELYWEQRAGGRAAVRAYRNVLRLERAEAALKTSESAPMAVMRALLSAEALLMVFGRSRPCPSCLGALDHRPRCRLTRMLDRIMLLRTPRVSAQKIRSARARRSSLRRGA